MFDRIQFIFSEALTSMRRNYASSLAAVVTAGIALYFLGGLAFGYIQLSNFANTVTDKFDMTVQLKDGTTEAQVKQTAPAIRRIQGVKSAVWIPRELEWERYKKNNPEIFRDIDNPIAEQIKVTLTDLKYSEDVAKAIRALPTVDTAPGSVSYMKAEQSFVQGAMGFFRDVGIYAGPLLFLVAGALIYNTIRLAILSRALEIRIMRLIGASRMTVRLPLVIEGIVHGAMGGILATWLLMLSYRYLDNLHQRWGVPDVATGKIADLPMFPFLGILEALTLIGAVYGLICSLVAIVVPHRNR